MRRLPTFPPPPSRPLAIKCPSPRTLLLAFAACAFLLINVAWRYTQHYRHITSLPSHAFSAANATSSPLKVYLLPIDAKLNFAMLQSHDHSIAVKTKAVLAEGWVAGGAAAGQDIQMAYGKDGLPVILPTYTDDEEAVELSDLYAYSAEYWMVLGLLAGLKSVQLVPSASQAEVVFVPAFSSFAKFNQEHPGKDRVPTPPPTFTDDVINLVLTSEETKQRPSAVLLPALHPLALAPKKHLLPATHFLLTDFSHSSVKATSLKKDVLLPLASLFSIFEEDDGSWRQRPNFAYFKGEIKTDHDGNIRKRLADLLVDDFDFNVNVVQPEAAVSDYFHEESIAMRRHKFCLVPAGNYPSSKRLFSAIVSGCLPVIISDHIELPYEDIIDYSLFAYFVPLKLAIKPLYLRAMLTVVRRHDWLRRWQHMRAVQHMFAFGRPDREGGAEDMAWRAVRRKIRGVKGKLDENRSKRKGLLASMLMRETEPVVFHRDDERPYSDYSEEGAR